MYLDILPTVYLLALTMYLILAFSVPDFSNLFTGSVLNALYLYI